MKKIIHPLKNVGIFLAAIVIIIFAVWLISHLIGDLIYNLHVWFSAKHLPF